MRNHSEREREEEAGRKMEIYKERKKRNIFIFIGYFSNYDFILFPLFLC